MPPLCVFLVLSGALRRGEERYLPFAEGAAIGETMTAYCSREVEPMGKEVEQVSMMALLDYMGLPVDIVYLDGR